MHEEKHKQTKLDIHKLSINIARGTNALRGSVATRKSELTSSSGQSEPLVELLRKEKLPDAGPVRQLPERI